MPLIVSCTTVKSSDGENLVIFWKNASKTPFGPVLGEKLLKQLDTAILELQSAYKPPKPPATDKRHKNAEKPATCLIQKPGVCGLYHFAWWFAQGQAKTKAPVISANLIETAYKNQACIQFFRQIAPFLQILGLIYQIIDPQDYWSALSRVRVMRARGGAWDLFCTSRRFPFHGVAVLRNLQVRPHRDRGDRKDGYTMMICAGNFTKGHLVIPDLRIRLDFKPVDVIMFKAAILEHYLTDFEGDRTSFVFFNHQNIWNYTKLA
ncbi:uncharacterized protein H6S33_009453 [Morchella sextelata]|uniref:uncharacterized protein n=1 Tax=Morchella sextelata TaxID=1174677 RepID=UPI001D03E118|nr:uncharacterized protein H6S33_009453 [Morchella sextelata]KAH0613073.1 hypothetical protein H6S33_009453 [Morchella sextelata]